MRIVIFIFFCFLFPSFSWADKAGEKLKLPDYYLGAWRSTAENYIYVVKDDGTITGYYSFGKKEKFQDVTYRILDVREDSVILFIGKVTLDAPFTGKDNKKPFYQFWTLKPYKFSFLPEKDIMWIEKGNLRPWNDPVQPEQKSDAWLLDYYNKDGFYNDHYSKFGHFRLPSGSFKE